MDRASMFHAFMTGATILWPWNGGQDTVRGVAESIEREDGSGYSFNVRVRLVTETGQTDRRITCYVSCPRR